jgi:hypothetical protein
MVSPEPPSAIGRSKPLASFLRSAGARFRGGRTPEPAPSSAGRLTVCVCRPGSGSITLALSPITTTSMGAGLDAFQSVR